MSTEAIKILDAIKQLSLSERLLIIELVFRDLQKDTANMENEEQRRRRAAELLLADYREDEELTVFATLDQEDFHETK